MYYWFFNVGIIREELPSKNRYTNFKNIKISKFEDLNKSEITRFIHLIQTHYLQNKENTFSPKQENVLPYFVGHNHPTFWSIYYQPELLIDQKTQTTIDNQTMVGVMTSRPLTVNIYTLNKNNPPKTMDVYYVDYLCVHKHWRKKQIAPQIIQTHEYVQSHQNRKISVSLFKREEELTGIIPLTVYTTYCFNMRNWNEHQNPLLGNQYSLLTGDKQNIYYLYNFIKDQSNISNKWGITIMPAISNLIELITTKNVFIKMIILDGNVEAAYIFKKTCTYIEAGKEIIACIASINGQILSNTDFIDGFKMALWSIIKDHSNFQYLIVEDISDNRCIIDKLMIRTRPLVSSPTAYFFYNFAYSTFQSSKCFIVL
jgi:hypothetical protein